MFCTECGAAVKEAFPDAAEPPLPAAVPVAVPVAEPVAVPVAEPVAKPVAVPVAEPVAKPVAVPVAEPVAKPVAVPVAEPVAKPVAVPVAEPVSEFAEPEKFSEAPPNAPELVTQVPPPPPPETPVSETPVSEATVEEVAEVAEKKSDNVIDVEIPPAEPEEEVAEKPKLSGKRVLIAIASVLISVVLFVAVTAGQSWVILRNGLNDQTVSAMARAILDEIELAEFPIFDFVNASDFELHAGVELRGDEVLSEAIFNVIDNYYIEEFGVEEEDIVELLERRELRIFLYEVVEGGVVYIMGGEDSQIVNPDSVLVLIESNEERIYSVTGYQLADTDFDDIKEVLSNAGLHELTWGSAIGESFNDGFNIRDAFALVERHANLALVLILIVFVGFTALLIVLNRRRVSDSLLYLGIPCMVSGLAVIVLSFITNILFGWIRDSLSMSEASMTAMRNTFASGAGNLILFSGLIVLGTGVVCVGVRVLVKVLKKA
jgi:hypothetical protein